ncbi:putative F-box/LRR-repeat protein 7 [Apostichopus japonicus]|uniref:Putative F-box/LRR-repeat protein 7 n=1 Tax=Stichopus japonicus TaxID=307972 RepID=A0A2G8KE47_STIJA|nr:putative F-box/LRR-repeat protein 7 [Apostichopus japonicus]
MVRRYYKSLKELDLTPWDFMVTEDYLVNIIMHGQLLRIIRLSKCWRASTATAVFLVANTCSRLQVLHISHCGSLTDQAVEDVARKCKELKEVDMSSCYKITDAAMCSLADHAKKFGRTLREQCLWGD